MKRQTLFCLLLLPPFSFLLAAPTTISHHLKIDQLGYLPAATKICVISDPQTGYNAAASFTPSSTYQVRRWDNDQVVFSGSPTAWNSGATHAQSGDKVWWFDFSALTTAGSYYVYDMTQGVGSYQFFIGENVYQEVLKQAVRVLYYQRSGYAKLPIHAGAWSDGASHLGTGQDLANRLVTSPNDASTEKDLSGGWYDAGDYNKYVNFTFTTLHDLLFAYQENPMVWGDDYIIPESNNGMPDLLDEVKWELDWLLKMQLADGSCLMKVAVTAFQSASPPSADASPRYYGAAQSSATRTIASIFAHASLVYRSVGVAAWTTYADTLLARAQRAWNWVAANPGYSTYGNTGFSSANPEISTYEQDARLACAAAFLYAATGNTSYKTHFENYYLSFHSMDWWYWYPFESTFQDVLLYYASLSGADPTVTSNIHVRCITSMTGNNPEFLTAFNNQMDAYRAYLKDADYVWGSNRTKCHASLQYLSMNTYGLDAGNAAKYQEAAGGYVHFLHGVNALGFMLLSNMSSLGGDSSANEIYHAWFADGTVYDNAMTSAIGPPPAYLTGGINPNYSPDAAYMGPPLIPPLSQPVQKSYKDWNTSWPENSWEITEPGIYYQAAYVRLLSHFAPDIQNPLVIGDLWGQGSDEKREEVFLLRHYVDPSNVVLEVEGPPSFAIEAALVALDGSLLVTQTGRLDAAGEGTMALPLESVASGYYVLRVQVGEEVVHRKVRRF